MGSNDTRHHDATHDRVPQLNETAVEALQFYVEKTRPSRSAPLFRSPRTGKPLSRVHVWRLMNKWAQQAGISDRVGAHTLRKTWGYQARKRGIPLELIQAKLGHSSPGVTRRYIGITADEIEQVEDEVNL
jgi:site-specific recombinase XerD